MNAEEVARILLKERIPITGFIRSIVLDAHTAEDIFQESSVKAIGRAESFALERDALAWTRTVARNRAIDHLRKEKRQGVQLSGDAIEKLAETAARESESFETTHFRALEECFKKLAPKTQEVLQMKYHQNLNGREVASELNRKPDAIYKTLTRAYQTLRDCMKRNLNLGKKEASLELG